MAAAGFCFVAAECEDDEDMCECVQCGLALDGWEDGDDPMHEHRKRAPNCAFFTQVKKRVATAKVKKVAGAKKEKHPDTTTSAAVSHDNDESIEDEFTVSIYCSYFNQSFWVVYGFAAIGCEEG
jgi:hypothetical protein